MTQEKWTKRRVPLANVVAGAGIIVALCLAVGIGGLKGYLFDAAAPAGDYPEALDTIIALEGAR